MRLRIRLNLPAAPLAGHATFPIEATDRTRFLRIPVVPKGGGRFSRLRVTEILLEPNGASSALTFAPSVKQTVEDAPPPSGFQSV